MSVAGHAGRSSDLARKSFSVLRPCRKGFKKFQPHLTMFVRTDISSPDYRATIRVHGIVRLQKGDGLARGPHCFSLHSGPILRKVNRRPFVKGLGIIGFNHQDNCFSE